MTLRRLAVLLAAVLLLAGAACRSGNRLESLDLEDFPAPAMFKEMAIQIRRPYLLELPPRSVDGRFDLHLKDVTVEEAMDAMVKLDPSFRHDGDGDVIVFRPSGEADVKNSPFGKPLPPFRVEAGVGEALRQVLDRAGLLATTDLMVETSGLHRPVVLDVKGGTVRDAMVEVARQAHLAFIVEPGSVSVGGLPE